MAIRDAVGSGSLTLWLRPEIYLFDEADALAGERSRGNDVGEIRQVLNSFLPFLEQDDSESLAIAASNHPQLLDRALCRR